MQRTCPSCNRTLQKSTFDKCMMCGADIPEHLRLSQTEKEDVRKEFQRPGTYRSLGISRSDNASIAMTGFDIGSDLASGD